MRMSASGMRKYRVNCKGDQTEHPLKEIYRYAIALSPGQWNLQKKMFAMNDMPTD